MESEVNAKGCRKPHYLSVWTPDVDSSEELVAQMVELLSKARQLFLIYEEIDCRSHHSETPVASVEVLSSMVSRMAAETAFIVLSDLETFALVPIAANEFVLIHGGSIRFKPSGVVKSRDSTDTYEDGDWFAFLDPEIAVILARQS
jgi:hypothetical protein